jgi:membrane protease YdiL (CAAX protease family)
VPTSDGALDRHQFLNLAVVFQGGMLLAALILAWWLEIDPWQYIAWDARSLILAALATAPLCGLSILVDRSGWSQARQLRELWTETLGPVLVQCRWSELVALSVLVGVSEELLFRGVLQVWLAQWSLFGALLATNVLFAIAHALTPTYAVLAGGIGFYLGVLMVLTDPPNLLVPIVCHAGCDLFSFWCIRRRLEHASRYRNEAQD